MQIILEAVRRGDMSAEQGMSEVWDLCNLASKRGEKLDQYVHATDVILGLSECEFEADPDVAAEFYRSRNDAS